MQILQAINQLKKQGKKGFTVLIDPDKMPVDRCAEMVRELMRFSPAFFLVGGSLLMRHNLAELIPIIKQESALPVVLFPGNILQIEDGADGILFLSLISGRNPELLIGSHVAAAPRLKQSGLEILPTGYMLIDSGSATTAHYMSGTQGIPREKPEIAAATAMAGEMLGLSMLYLDGGSGAKLPVTPQMIKAVAQSVQVPLLVGGGIRDLETAEAAFEAGADLLVIGTALEIAEGSDFISGLSEMVKKMNAPKAQKKISGMAKTGKH